MGKVIGVIAVKGGVGKTTTVSNLGAVLASEFNKKVLIVDANLTAPNLGIHFGLIDPEVTIYEVLSDKSKIFEAIYEYRHNLHILPASLLPKKVNSMKLKEKLDELKDHYDIIILDSSPSLNDDLLAVIRASNELLVVSSPDYPTISSTVHAIKLANEHKVPVKGIILNKIRGKKFELTTEDVERVSDTPVLAVFRDDLKVLHALSKTKPITLHYPKSKIAREYKRLAALLIGELYKESSFWNNFMRALRQEIPKEEVEKVLLTESIKKPTQNKNP